MDRNALDVGVVDLKFEISKSKLKLRKRSEKHGEMKKSGVKWNKKTDHNHVRRLNNKTVAVTTQVQTATLAKTAKNRIKICYFLIENLGFGRHSNRVEGVLLI